MSDTYHADAGGDPSLTRAFRHMPGWKIKLLGVSLVLGAVGAVGQFVSSNLKHTAPVASAPPTHAAPAPSATPSATPSAAPSAVPGSNGFMSGVTPAPGATAAPASPSTTATPTPVGPTWNVTDFLTPKLTAIGFSLFIGVVVGVIFRTFLKLAAVLTAVVVALAVALSYFHVVNVDLTQVKDQAGHVTGWLSDQGMRLKDVIFAHLPSTGGAAAGFLFGMKKR